MEESISGQNQEAMNYIMPINRPPLIPYAIGIDSDIDRSGLAVWSRVNKRHSFISAVPFWVLIDRINNVEPGKAEWYVDAGWLNEGYHHYDQLPDDFEKWAEKSKWAYMVKCGIQVGRNFGVGQVTVAYLRAHKHIVHEVRPVSAKWDRHDLKRYTGWVKRTNQDARDAAKQCFQR